MTSTSYMGYVTDTRSSCGQFRCRRFNDPQDTNPENEKWVTAGEGGAKTGKAHQFQPGHRVVMTQVGGPDGAFIAHATGALPRAGSGDNAQTPQSVNKQKTDYPIPIKNYQENGKQVEADRPLGDYHQRAGQALDNFNNKYPEWPFYA